MVNSRDSLFSVALDKFTPIHKLARELFELKERCAAIRTGLEQQKETG